MARPRYQFEHWKLIPNFSLAQDFVYFDDLIESVFPIPRINNRPLNQRKITLYNAALNAMNQALTELSNAPTLDTAFEFIGQIASNERKKELQVVKQYCDKINQQYPDFINMSEEDILMNPDNFYKELIKYINKAREQALTYENQLRRIKTNAGKIDQDLKKKSKSDYAKDNYLYRLASDTESLLKKIIGTFEGNDKSADAFTTKMQDMVMEILKSQNVPNLIQSGEDFAAIAVGLLADIEQKIQAEFDKQVALKDGPKLLEELSDETLMQIKQAYIKNIESENEGTGVQQALKALNSQDFLRIITNIKQTLKLKQLPKGEKANKQIQKVTELANNRRIRRRSQDRLMNHMRASFNRKKKLVNELMQLEFTNLSSDTFHGNLYELVESVINNNAYQLGDSGAAVDVITLEITPSQQINTNAINQFAQELSNNITNFALEDTHAKDALSRELSSAITTMNNDIDTTLQKLDELIKNSNTQEPLFIFHESLKLYSSIETGKSSSFSGRTLNILTMLDYISAALGSVGINIPGSNGIMRALALNLSELAVGGHVATKLEDYLSLFAGLLMFDDITNIAQEAVNKIQYDSVNVIHLYLLNGIYVPASTILAYIYDSCIQASNIISSGDAARIEIQTSGADNAIKDWLTNRPSPLPNVWEKIGYAAASGTQAHIIFFAGFINFISSL